MRQGCKLFKVVPPHLILVTQICVCIIIGYLDWVIDALRQVDWFHVKFKSIVGWLSLARFLFQSNFGHHISVWQQIVRVNCGQQLYWTLAQDRVANFLRSSLLISYWLFGFVFASLLEIWIELLMHWGRSTDFTSSSSQLLDGYLLQDFSSNPNLVITFLFGNIVWESTVANTCIRHWYKAGL